MDESTITAVERFQLELQNTKDRFGMPLIDWLPTYQVDMLKELVEGKPVYEFEIEYGPAYRPMIADACRTLIGRAIWCAQSHSIREPRCARLGEYPRYRAPWSVVESFVAIALYRSGASDEMIVDAIQRRPATIWRHIKENEFRFFDGVKSKGAAETNEVCVVYDAR